MIRKIIQTILLILSIIAGTLIGGGILIVFVQFMFGTHSADGLFFWLLISIPPFMVIFIPWYRLYLAIKTKSRGKHSIKIDLALILFSLAIGWLGMEGISGAAMP